MVENIIYSTYSAQSIITKKIKKNRIFFNSANAKFKAVVCYNNLLQFISFFVINKA